MAQQTVELNTVRVGEETIITIGETWLVMDRNGELAGAGRGSEKYSQYPIDGWEVAPDGDMKKVLVKFILAEAASISKALMQADDDEN